MRKCENGFGAYLRKQKGQLSQRNRAMLRVIEYFAKSCNVTQGHSNSYHSKSLSTVSYSPSIVVVALSCVISEIKRDIGRKSRFFSYTLHLTPPLGGPCRNIAISFGMEKLE